MYPTLNRPFATMRKKLNNKSNDNAISERSKPSFAKPNNFKSQPGKKKLNERTKTRLSGQTSTSKTESRKGAIPDDKKLKVIGHQLKPCVLLSESSLIESDLSEAIIKETKARLEDHELIKVKIRLLDREDRLTVLQKLMDATGARKIHLIGKVALLFKPSTSFSAKLSNIERHRQLI